MRKHHLAVGALVLLVHACTDVRQPQEVGVTFTNVGWLVDRDQGGVYLLDTGTPRTQVLPSVLGSGVYSFAETVWDDPFGLNVDREEVVVASEFPPFLAISPNFYGIIGADLVGQRPYLYSPKNDRLVLNPDPSSVDPASVEEGQNIPMQVLGGSGTCLDLGCFEWGATRLIVPVTLNGVETWGLVDTGIGPITVSQRFFERHFEDEQPPTFQMVDLVDPDFSSVAPVRMTAMTVETVTVGEVVETDVRVDVPPVAGGLEAALARLSVEVGMQVEVLLGNSFWVRYASRFDHQTGELTVYRHLEQDHSPDRVSARGVVDSESLGGMGFDLAPMGALPQGDCFFAVRTVVGGEGEQLGLAEPDICFTSIHGISPGPEDALFRLSEALDALPMGAAVDVMVDRGAGAESFVLHIARNFDAP